MAITHKELTDGKTGMTVGIAVFDDAVKQERVPCNACDGKGWIMQSHTTLMKVCAACSGVGQLEVGKAPFKLGPFIDRMPLLGEAVIFQSGKCGLVSAFEIVENRGVPRLVRVTVATTDGDELLAECQLTSAAARERAANAAKKPNALQVAEAFSEMAAKVIGARPLNSNGVRIVNDIAPATITKTTTQRRYRDQ